jgi:methylated-DNA-protein-cysteine methyltransferase-like protein
MLDEGSKHPLRAPATRDERFVPTPHSRIYAIIARIPRGRVATYGQVAKLVRPACGPRQVGYALAALPDNSTVPWHRVVNAAGRISLRGHSAVTQRLRLLTEGVEVGEGGRLDLGRFGWKPRVRSPAAAHRAADCSR